MNLIDKNCVSTQQSPRVKNQVLRVYFCLSFYLVKYLETLVSRTSANEPSVGDELLSVGN